MKTLDEVILCLDGCGHIDCDDCPYHYEDEKIEVDDCTQAYKDALHYLKAFRDAKDALDAEREKSIEAYCQWKDAREKLEAQTSQMMWVDKHFQFEISDNPPLTWSELKQMEGKPVWVEGEHGCIWDQKAWSLIRLDPENDDLITCVCTDGGVHYEFAIGQEDYGTDWQAYRKERE